MTDKHYAVIGGTGLCDWPGAERLQDIALETPWGAPSAAVQQLRYRGESFFFLPRHAGDHSIPPHAINYRANIAALAQLPVQGIIAVNAVGGIGERYGAGAIAVPDQLIDYTWGREHSFYDGINPGLEHVDFTEPYSRGLRAQLLGAAAKAEVSVVDGGCYAVTQGPRLETAAEVRKLAADGCQLIGMTAMPEAALAREKGLDYASLCLVVNPAAGLGDTEITMDDIRRVLAAGMDEIQAVLAGVFAS